MLGESLPYGLRDVKVSPIVNGVVGASVDLPNSQIFSFEETEEFDELRGDDKVRARRGRGPSVNWSLEAGGISLEAYVVINGGTLTATGVTPNQKKTYTKKATQARPEFQVEGRSISESGGDFHTTVFRCKAEGRISGEQSDGTFWVTKCEGTAIGRLSDDTIYEFTQNETAVEIADGSVPEPTIQSIAPEGRSAGEIVVITGDSFSGATAVSIDGASVPDDEWTLINDNTIMAVIPATASGTAPVIVTTEIGASDPVDYTVV